MKEHAPKSIVDKAKKVMAPVALALATLGCGPAVSGGIRSGGFMHVGASFWVTGVDGVSFRGHIDPNSSVGVDLNVIVGGTPYNGVGADVNWFGGRTPRVTIDKPGELDWNASQ